MKTRRKKRKKTETGTLAGTVQLSNKCCPEYYHPKDPAAVKRCDCPKGRCWYDEQLTRRSKYLLALTPEEWMSRIKKPSFVERCTEVISQIDIDTSPCEDTRLRGEKKRFTSSIQCLKDFVEALEDAIEAGVPTSSIQQAMTSTAVQAGNHAAVIDALVFEDK